LQKLHTTFSSGVLISDGGGTTTSGIAFFFLSFIVFTGSGFTGSSSIELSFSNSTYST